MDNLNEQPADVETSPGGQMDIIYGQYPPNFDMIVEAFPMAAKPGVVFAYGDEIYVPSGKPLTHELKVHEAVHGIRQKELGLDMWWKKYIEDEALRYHEELIAHFAEFRALIQGNETRNHRRAAMKHVAKKLSHPLYCCEGGLARATKDLKRMEKEYLEGTKAA